MSLSSQNREPVDQNAVIAFHQLHHFIAENISSAERLIDVFAPFITLEALKEILAIKRNKVQVNIITRWKLIDFILGSCDLDLFEYCQINNYRLFVNQKLHLKTIVRDQKAITIGSANVTGRGLGLVEPANYEFMIHLEEPDRLYLLFLEQIKLESVLVTEEIFKKFREMVNQFQNFNLSSLKEILEAENQLQGIFDTKDYFLVSELPMSQSISKLYAIVCNINTDFDEETIATAQSDIVKYHLLGKVYPSEYEFRTYLAQQFFQHLFIKELSQFINQPRRFGEIKAWVQQTCTDVPVPSRRSLTGNVQVLYEWLVELGGDRFFVYRPNISQIISPKE